MLAAARFHSSNIRLENDKKLLTEQIAELTGKIADSTEDNTEAIKSLADKSEAKIKTKDKEIESLRRELDLMRQQQIPKDRVDRKAIDMLVEIAKRKDGFAIDSLFKYFFGHATPQGEHFFAQLVQAKLVEQLGVNDKGVAIWGATQKGKDVAFSRPS